MATDDSDIPETDLREQAAEADDGDSSTPLSKRIRERTAAFRKRRAKQRARTNVERQSKQLKKRRRRRDLRESADNVVNAVTGRSLDDLSMEPDEAMDDADESESTSFLDRFAPDDADGDGADEPLFFDVDGDGDVDAIFPSGGGGQSSSTAAQKRMGSAPVEFDITVDEATVEFPTGERQSRSRRTGSSPPDRSPILPEIEQRDDTSRDDDDFPPLY